MFTLFSGAADLLLEVKAPDMQENKYISSLKACVKDTDDNK